MKINSTNLLIYNSFWPLINSINIIFFIFNIIFLTLNLINYKILLIHSVLILYSLNNWITNIFFENYLIGLISLINQIYLKIFIILIIISESIFFLSFFYINSSILNFNNQFFNFNLKLFINLNFILSFLNLIILLRSRITLIIYINLNLLNKIKSLNYLNLTIILGLYFLLIQIFEYKIIIFNISNTIYYSNFFLLTFFHINHVIIGILILILFNYLTQIYLFSNIFKLKIICWYWHFIDFIWIIIFILIYYFINIINYI